MAENDQEMQEVQLATRFLEVAKGLLPMESQVAIDGMETLTKIKEKMGDEIVLA